MDQENNSVIILEKGVMYSTWCTICWPKKEHAVFIFDGFSICEEHFNRKQKSLEKTNNGK